MVELDKVFEGFAKAVNECYENVFPGLCQYPKFSLSRAMIVMWKKKVYSKIGINLLNAFMQLIQERRSFEIKAGKTMTSKKPSHGIYPQTEGALLPTLRHYNAVLANEVFGTRNIELMGRFAQAVADLSVNEITVHYLGSTKAKVEEPYAKLDKAVLKQTK